MGRNNDVIRKGTARLMCGVLLMILSFSSSALAIVGEDVTGESLILRNFKWVGGYDGMIQRRGIRVLMPYSRTFFFLDGVTEKGLGHEIVKNFENYINARHKTKHLKIHLVIIPTEREVLLSHLSQGLGDIAVGNLTMTEERRKTVDFSDPLLTDVKEIIVTGKQESDLKSTVDLAGKEIYVRQSSSYHESLLKLNEVLVATGKSPVKITLADEHLEDEDFAARFKKAGEAWDVALQLAALRKESGLSQKELARQVGTSQQQISRLESPSYEGHSLSTLRRVAEVLGATLHVEIQRKKHPKQVRLQQIAEAKSNYGI